LAVLKEFLIASISVGLSFDSEYQINDTPRTTGKTVKMVFLGLNFKNYVSELSFSFGKTMAGLKDLASSNSKVA